MQYQVKPGCYHGVGKTFGPGAIVELEPEEAAGFLDKLEPVEPAPATQAEPASEWGGLPDKIVDALQTAGLTPAQVAMASDDDLLAIDGIGRAALTRVREVFPAGG